MVKNIPAFAEKVFLSQQSPGLFFCNPTFPSQFIFSQSASSSVITQCSPFQCINMATSANQKANPLTREVEQEFWVSDH